MDAVQARSDWMKRREAKLAAAVELLKEVAVEDFQHQVGPRRCSDYAGFTEVVGNIKAGTERIAEDLEREFTDWYMINR